MSRVARGGLVFLCAAAALILVSSCRREAPSNVDRNRAPETYINRAPAESSLTYYRARFFWSGSDPDGDIAYYEIAVTDSNEVPGQNLEEGTGYTRTLATDSLFVLKADPPIEQQISGKRIYVRAVDNEGKIDPTPALAYFVVINDFYPQVQFTGDRGEWTDKCGNSHVRIFNGVTDTIGIEGTVRWTWTGTDRDPGGSIAGYEWKLGSQTRYQGGTLADTVAQVTFPRNASRRQSIQVRGIDDGGLRSFDDFTQSVVLNFDPITWIVYPIIEDDKEGGEGGAPPEKGRYFLQGLNVWPSGTILPDVGNNYSVEVQYTGFDDPRDKQPTCDEAGVHKYQTRVLKRDDSFGTPGGTLFYDLPANESRPYPARNSNQYNELNSGDHFILIRAVDDFSVFDSTPDTVIVRVNYPPYMVRFEARPGNSAESDPWIDLLAVRNSSFANPIDIQLDPGEVLQVRALGRDVHYPNPLGLPEPDTLAARYDSSLVVGQEIGSLNPVAAYRIFIESAFEVGYEPLPPGGAASPYVADLVIETPGTYRIIADVQDRSNTNEIGRRGRIIRYIRITR